MTQNDATVQNVIVVGPSPTPATEVSPDVALLQVNLEADADSAGEALTTVSDRAIGADQGW